MLTTSLAISERLYELTGWDDTHFVWSKRINGSKANVEMSNGHGVAKRTETPYVIQTKHRRTQQTVLAPAYELGYLLRKLPAYIATHDEHADDYKLRLSPNYEGTMWYAEYAGIERLLYFEQTDTPEEAACLLAIKLIEERIIIIEGRNGQEKQKV